MNEELESLCVRPIVDINRNEEGYDVSKPISQPKARDNTLEDRNIIEPRNSENPELGGAVSACPMP